MSFRSPHVMHVIDSLAIGGAERMLVEIVNQLRPTFQPLVCVTRSNLTLAGKISAGIPVYELGRNSRFDLEGMKRFSKVVREKSVDIIHAHGRSSFAFAAFTLSIQRIRVPLVLHEHYGIDIDDEIPAWFRIWGKYRVSAFVGVYEKHTEWAARAGIPEDRIKVIPNGIDLTPFISGQKIRSIKVDNKPCGVMVCGIRYVKGLDLLIQAISLIQPRPRMKILIVGDVKERVYYESCINLIKDLGLGEIFEFLGERTDIPQILHSVDFGFIPSRSESGPLVMIEYMASGLPVVAFKTGNISIKAAQSGIPGIVSAGDIDAFSVEINHLINLSEEDLKTRGELSRHVADETFDIKMQIPKWFSIYDQVLNGRVQ
jgi:glycosyltransferase involved in cell wall biosynthesis